LWLREIAGCEHGSAPSVDLVAERKTSEFVRHLIEQGLVNAVHDVADGGLLVALAEMALAGGIGAELDPAIQLRNAAGWFGEDQGRFIVTVADPAGSTIVGLAEAAGVHFGLLGFVGGQSIAGDGLGIDLDDLRHAHEAFFPRLMGGELAVA
jgi:phosphoribosylformylglycinamidine synthase